jgi:LSD1 subclass zinc finger protein
MKWLKKFMTGRYGVDQLTLAIMGVSILFSVLSIFINNHVLDIINVIILIIVFYRIFSKNVSKRYQENMKFLNAWNFIKNKTKNKLKMIKDLKHYRFYKCSNCRQTLRVPKGKGKISITCPKCKTVMIKKS